MTSLSQQLKALETPETNLLDHGRKPKSILFTESACANYQRETFFKIGQSGFLELIEINSGFEKFRKNLFDSTSIEFQRSIQNKEVNDTLDIEIEHFLLLLSPYLQKQASLKALEWLIHRYYIEEKNVDSLMMCILPYYESVLFSRILQVICIQEKQSPWAWLLAAHKNGVSIPKHTLFQQWISSTFFRNFINQYFSKMKEVHKSELMISISFFITTQLGGILTCNKLTENHLVSISQGLEEIFLYHNEEIITGYCVIFSQLASSEDKLSYCFLQKILLYLSNITKEKVLIHVANCVLVILHLQNGVEFQNKTLQSFNTNVKLLQKLKDIADEKTVGCFFGPYMFGMAKMILNTKKNQKEEIDELFYIVQELCLSSTEATIVISQLLKGIISHLDLLDESVNIVQMCKELEKSHPEGYNSVDFHKFEALGLSSNVVAPIEIKELKPISPSKKNSKGKSLKEWEIELDSFVFDKKKLGQPFWIITEDKTDVFSQSVRKTLPLLSNIIENEIKGKKDKKCHALLKKLFLEKLGNLKNQLYFLAMIFGWHTDISMEVSSSLKFWALKLSTALIKNHEGELCWVLSPHEPLLVSLVPNLCDEGFLCEAAVELLQLLVESIGSRLRDDSLIPIVESILAFKEEIKADSSYLPLSVSAFLNKKPTLGWKMASHILSLVTSPSVPEHLKCSALFLIARIHRKEILSQLLPLAGSILNRIALLKKDKSLDPISSTLLYYIILRFSSKEASFLQMEGGWNLFIKVVELTTPIMQVNESFLVPQDLVVNYKVLEATCLSDKQVDILDVLISRAVKAHSPSEASKLRRELKKLSIEANTINALLSRYSRPKILSIKQAMSIKPKTEVKNCIEDENWQKISLVVECVGVMEGLKEPYVLLRPLLRHLERSLETGSDIFQQQLLSVLHHLITSSLQLSSKNDLAAHLDESVVTLCVKCIRQSHNPDTHRRALLILSVVANFFPETVLHNIMAVFTFMGNWLLCRDDAYSFQVIHQTITSIVPTLIKNKNHNPESLLKKLAQVTQVFVDALPDLAEHRKLPLFTQLAETLGVSQYLWLMMILIVDACVTKGVVDASTKGVPANIQFALLLYSQFSVDDQLIASGKVLEFACNIPFDKETLKTSKQPLLNVIDLNHHTPKQMLQLKYSCIGLLGHLISSDRFVGQVSQRMQDNMDAFHTLLQEILHKMLSYVKEVSYCEEHLGKFGYLQRKCMDLVQAVNSLLPPPSFVLIISNLLEEESPLIRNRAMEFLGYKLQPDLNFFDPNETEILVPFIDSLLIIVRRPEETPENRQIGLFTLQLLIRFLGHRVNSSKIFPVLRYSVEIMAKTESVTKVETQSVLVVAECVHVLGAESMPLLGALVPTLLRLLNAALTNVIVDAHTIAAATTFCKVLESIPQFISKSCVKDLLVVSCRLLAKQAAKDQKEAKISSKLTAIQELLITKIESRVLVGVSCQAFEKVTCESFSPLMTFLEKLIGSINASEMNTFKRDFVELFTAAFDVRQSGESLEVIRSAEGSVISATSRFLLKLNEEDNNSIFSGFVNWAWTHRITLPGRLTTFFRFAQNQAEKLQDLFVQTKLAHRVLDYAAKVLDLNNVIHNDQGPFGSDVAAADLSCELLSFTLKTVEATLKFDRHDKFKFTTPERFHLIVTPLIDQVENTMGGCEKFERRVRDHVTPCVVALASAVVDDSLWKELNRQLLLRVKCDQQPQIILSALDILESLMDAKKEDFLQPLLADTMPCITEILESSNPEVERRTKEVFAKMESILGDDLRAYLDG